MKWYPLSPFQFIILLVLVVITDIFTIVQKYAVPETARPLVYLVVVVLVLLGYFFVIHPDDPGVLASTLSILLAIITLVLIIVQDVILAYTLSWRTAIVLLGAVAGPFVAGYIYRKIRLA